jgi:uncharacterized membrane protein (Fun14 family)
MTNPSSNPPSNISTGRRTARSIFFQFVSDLIQMPRWHKGVLGTALAIVLLGWAHRGYHAIADSNLPPISATGIQQPTPTTQPAPSLLAGWARRVGASVLLGFLVGWVFRTFLKIMSSITALVLGTLILLSYFNVMNIDFTAAENKYKDTSSWVTDQAGRLRDSATGHIHSTLGGALGIFIGWRKKTAIV